MLEAASSSARDSTAPKPVALAVVVTLFAGSGCAALIYQVVWFERLSLTIGSSALSLGVVLATFMGGLGLGSLLASRERSNGRPLRRYAFIELAIGLLGAATLSIIPLLGGAYTALSGGGSASIGLRLVVAGIALLPATVLMGATLPIVAPWLRRAQGGTRWLGWCYAANAAGGVIGSITAGFYLLRVYDAHVATFAAVALNVVVAAVALALASRDESTPAAALVDARRTAPPRPWPVAAPVYLVTALSGMTALAAEVLWTRHLALLLGGTVYTFALILAVLLAGLALGSAAGAALGQRSDPRAALALCQVLLGVAMAVAASTLARSLPYWPIDVELPTMAAVALELDLLRTAWVVLPSAVLWGASFPLALATVVGAGEAPRRAVGRLYAANTAGAIAGALATTFVLVVVLGSQRTQQLMIAASGAAALLLLATATRPRRGVGVATATIAVGMAAATVPTLPPQLVAFGRFLPTRGANANVLYVGEGLTASVAVSTEADGTLIYHNAGKTQASTYLQDMRLQRMLGHLTTLAVEQPRNVLVIGLGAGVTAGAVTLDPAVERVVVAELEPLVPRVAAGFFAEQNFGVVGNEKVEIRIDDGRHLLATARERFDAITSDPLDPWVKGSASLYTREFWELCKERLTDGGVVTVFVPLYETTEAAVRSQLATFFDVFPGGMLFANDVDGSGYDAVLLGRRSDEPIDLQQLERRLEGTAYEHVYASLRAVGFRSALDLVSTLAADAASLEPWLAGAPRNTDRNLRLQYLAGQGVNVFAAPAIMSAMTAAPPDATRSFTGTLAQLEELRQRLAADRRR